MQLAQRAAASACMPHLHLQPCACLKQVVWEGEGGSCECGRRGRRCACAARHSAGSAATEEFRCALLVCRPVGLSKRDGVGLMGAREGCFGSGFACCVVWLSAYCFSSRLAIRCIQLWWPMATSCTRKKTAACRLCQRTSHAMEIYTSMCCATNVLFLFGWARCDPKNPKIRHHATRP